MASFVKFDRIGDIACTRLPPDRTEENVRTANEIIARTRIRCVANRVMPASGAFRVAGFEVIAGSGTVTCHRESGFSYGLDLRSAFFNPRLAYERRRVAGMVLPGEKVLIPFVGVGPFAIPVAARDATVVAADISMECCRWLLYNTRQNRVEKNVTVLCADAGDLPSMITTTFDRAILPAPYGMDTIAVHLAPLVKEGGTIHTYHFKKAHQIPGLEEWYAGQGFTVAACRRCGNVAPGVCRWALEIRA
ncbi:MAG: hypothetical protein RQ758_07040 [Methanomicrobiaceae archaeon]|nr:hypothetical protein [Methanomicrobiaceae archaeon]